MNGLTTNQDISKDFLFNSYPILTSVSSRIWGTMCVFLTGPSNLAHNLVFPLDVSKGGAWTCRINPTVLVLKETCLALGGFRIALELKVIQTWRSRQSPRKRPKLAQFLKGVLGFLRVFYSGFHLVISMSLQNDSWIPNVALRNLLQEPLWQIFGLDFGLYDSTTIHGAIFGFFSLGLKAMSLCSRNV